MTMLRWIGQGFSWLHGIVFAVTAVFHLWFWIRKGFWVPRYVHVMALIAVLIGIGLERIVPDDAPARSQGVLGYLFIVLVFPALVYGAFVLLGGALAAPDGQTHEADDGRQQR